MDTLQVPTHEIDVELRIGRGETIDGRMFASELPVERPGAEMLFELLNDERTFVPFEAHHPMRGRVAINKQHIVAAHLTVPEGDETHAFIEPGPGDSDETCSVLLSTGERLTGRLRVATPWSASRVLDKLNQAPRFVPVVTPDGISLVHRDHIVRVW